LKSLKHHRLPQVVSFLILVFPAMERFQETLSTTLEAEVAEEIGKLMVAQVIAPKEEQKKTSKIQLDKFDWTRVEFADLRDARTTSKPCEGNHSAEGFERGSHSGMNGHALWLTCHRCKLRLMYVPVHGAKGCYRSPGPIGKDVVQKLIGNPEAAPSELHTKALALEAAENSAKKLLDKIQVEKAKMKAKAKPSPGAPSSSPVTPPMWFPWPARLQKGPTRRFQNSRKSK
jgi:hypothetical protein